MRAAVSPESSELSSQRGGMALHYGGDSVAEFVDGYA